VDDTQRSCALLLVQSIAHKPCHLIFVSTHINWKPVLSQQLGQANATITAAREFRREHFPRGGTCLTCPIMIGGDFNSLPTSAVYRCMVNGGLPTTSTSTTTADDASFNGKVGRRHGHAGNKGGKPAAAAAKTKGSRSPASTFNSMAALTVDDNNDDEVDDSRTPPPSKKPATTTTVAATATTESNDDNEEGKKKNVSINDNDVDNDESNNNEPVATSVSTKKSNGSSGGGNDDKALKKAERQRIKKENQQRMAARSAAQRAKKEDKSAAKATTNQSTITTTTSSSEEKKSKKKHKGSEEDNDSDNDETQTKSTKVVDDTTDTDTIEMELSMPNVPIGGFTSVYGHYTNGRSEPSFTQAKPGEHVAIDYLWVENTSVVSSSSTLPTSPIIKLMDRSPLPELTTVRKGLPNANWGSDHLPLACTLAISLR
jgi:hypothetical protein